MKKLTEQQINILKKVINYDIAHDHCYLPGEKCRICPFSRNNNKFYFNACCTLESKEKIHKICKDYLASASQLELF